MAEEAGTNIPMVPRLFGIRMQRENIRAVTPDEYYRQTITIPLLDHLLMELTNRFNEHARKAAMCLSALSHQWWGRLTTGAITLTAWLSCSKKICPHHCHYLRSSIYVPLSSPTATSRSCPAFRYKLWTSVIKRHFLISSDLWKLQLHCQWQHARLNDTSRPCAGWKCVSAPQS